MKPLALALTSIALLFVTWWNVPAMGPSPTFGQGQLQGDHLGLSLTPSLAPPNPSLLKRLRAEGRLNELAELERRGRARGIDQAVAATGAPTGTKRALVILIDFPDTPAVMAPSYFRKMLFSRRVFPTGSLRDYFRQVSYGQLDIKGVVKPTTFWFRAPHSMAHYANDQYGWGPYPRNAQKLAEEAVLLLDATGFDFSPYDANGDGFVDYLFIVHSGVGAEHNGRSDHIWSHAWVTHEELSVGGGKKVRRYTMLGERQDNSGTPETMGVFAHELSHVLGLPDLYDTDGSSAGVGRWSLMGIGTWNSRPGEAPGSSPAHLDAWSKMQLGWLQPSKLARLSPSRLRIPAVERRPVVYKLQWREGSPEYFLIENRQRIGFDRALPGRGLLIWHIDDAVPHNRNEEGSAQAHYKVALMQADGRRDLESGNNLGDASDPYPGKLQKRAFAGKTNPSSNSWRGAVTFISVRQIVANSKAVVASIRTDREVGKGHPRSHRGGVAR